MLWDTVWEAGNGRSVLGGLGERDTPVLLRKCRWMIPMVVFFPVFVMLIELLGRDAAHLWQHQTWHFRALQWWRRLRLVEPRPAMVTCVNRWDTRNEI